MIMFDEYLEEARQSMYSAVCNTLADIDFMSMGYYEVEYTQHYIATLCLNAVSQAIQPKLVELVESNQIGSMQADILWSSSLATSLKAIEDAFAEFGHKIHVSFDELGQVRIDNLDRKS